MRKGLLALTFLTLTGLGLKAQDIPEAVKAKATDYLSYAARNCGTVPEIILAGKKLEDRNLKQRPKDGIKDSVFLYQINNTCDWMNVPSYIVYVIPCKKDGTFEEIGFFEESGIISKDEKGKPVMPKEW
jgi:hypothetical protein